MTRALSGIRILDCSSGVAGPFGARLLANLGADVILVEPPDSPNPLVSEGERARQARRRLALNGGKRSISLDLETPPGRTILDQLLEQSHAVIQNAPLNRATSQSRRSDAPVASASASLFSGDTSQSRRSDAPVAGTAGSPSRGDTLSTLAITDFERTASWPHLVVTTVSPLGTSGPDAGRVETELTVAARSSWLSSVGDPEREPLAYPGPQISYITGFQVAIATASALLLSQQTGEGQSIDVTMLESITMAFDQHLLGALFVPSRRQRRAGRRTLRFPPVILPTANGFVSTLVTDNQWPRFARMCGQDDLAADPSLRHHAARTARMEELEAIMIPWFLERTKEEIFAVGQRFGVPITPFNSVEELLREPHFLARDLFVSQEHDGRLIDVPGRPFLLSVTPWRQVRPAPTPGQHTATIEAELRAPSNPNRTRNGAQRNDGPVVGQMANQNRDSDGAAADKAKGEGRRANQNRDSDGAAARVSSDQHNRDSDGAAASGRSAPLAGIRVIDFTSAWAGPRLSTYLAELGADVIHLESIQYLDAHRGWTKWGGGAIGLHPNGDLGAKPWERSSLYLALNKGKRGLTLNLGDPAGRDLFRQLLSLSDVLIDNYRVGQLAKFGLDEATLRSICPDIILVSLPAFGSWGPYRDYTAWGDQASAISGLGQLLRYPDQEEPEPGGTYGDPIAAASGTLAVLAAIRHRRRTGQGQTVEVPLTEGLIPLLAEPILEYGFTGRLPDPVGSGHPEFAPWGLYRSSGDDRWIAICVETDDAFAALANAIEQPGLALDPRFANNAARRENRTALDPIISGWTIERDAWSAADRLQAVGVAAEPVQEINELVRDRQLVARDFFVEIEHPEAGLYPYIGPAVRYGESPATIGAPPPTVGEHNEQILNELLGVTGDELDQLAAALVIGDEPLEDTDRRG